MQTSDLAMVAIQAALEAGDLLKKGFSTNFSVSNKEGKQNLVTEYDKASEKCIIESIKKRFPGHGFLAEESGDSGNASSEIVWVIDPLDGTVNFAYGIPFFSVSIAAVQGDLPLAGVVYNPLLGELFFAEKGKGAYFNGKRMSVSNKTDLDKSLLATGFPYNVEKNPNSCIDHVTKVLSMGIPIRRLGSAALDLSYIACGRFDAYWEMGLHPWDIAAGKLLVEEAGGMVTHYDGSNRPINSSTNILATNKKLHGAMMNILR
jgi:myo-inositol-1(or 4)-monophosphatase